MGVIKEFKNIIKKGNDQIEKDDIDLICENTFILLRYFNKSDDKPLFKSFNDDFTLINTETDVFDLESIPHSQLRLIEVCRELQVTLELIETPLDEIYKAINDYIDKKWNGEQ